MPEKFPSPEQPAKQPQKLEKPPFSGNEWDFYQQHKEEIGKDYAERDKVEREYESVLEDIDKILTTAKDREEAKKIILEKWRPIAYKAFKERNKLSEELGKKYGPGIENLQVLEGVKKEVEEEPEKTPEERKAEQEKEKRLWAIEDEFVIPE